MNRRALLIAAFALVVVASCSNEEPGGPGAGSGAGSGAPAEALAKLPMLPGDKYYVGGPILKRDKYGKYRIRAFEGEVEQPPSRGMIFGAKLEGDKMEYRVWANGKLLAVHRGTMRDGIFWQEYAEGYRDEKLTSRERDENIDAEQRTKSVLEDIDPDNGEVIRVTESYLSYFPPKIDMDDEDDKDWEDDDTEDDEATAPAAPPAAAPPAGQP
jgi:hypothetical protein